jgi:DNA-binding transcriptional ArsR family regulator
VLKALAHHLRIRILTVLCELGPMTLRELAEYVGESDNLTLFHVDKLIAADLVTAEYARALPSAPTPGRGRGRIYAAREAVLMPESVWAELPKQFRESMAGRLLGILHRDAEKALEHGFLAPGDAHLSLTPLVLDGTGLGAVSALLSRTADELLAIQRDCASRVRGDRGDIAAGQAVTVGLIGFRSTRDPADGVKAPQTVRL